MFYYLAWFYGSKVQDNCISCTQNVITAKIIFIDSEQYLNIVIVHV